MCSSDLSTQDEMIDFATKSGYSMGLAQIPELMIDNTDRNRTSPFAFTGNRFEFRAVGSSANCAAALLALNAAVADQLNDFHSKVEKRIKDAVQLSITRNGREKALYGSHSWHT